MFSICYNGTEINIYSMNTSNNHSQSTTRNTLVDQFTKQAIPFSRMPAHSNEIGRLVELSRVTACDHVLDLACGPGLVATAFAQVAKQVTGIDITQAMVDLASVRNIPNATFRTGDATDLPFPASTFDVVVTRYSVHHFENPHSCFAEMARVCKPSGWLVVADMQPSAASQQSFNALERLRDPSHQTALTAKEMQSQIETSGFALKQVEEYGVTVDLETQLRSSFPNDGDGERFRNAVVGDIGTNHYELNARKSESGIAYTYPIGIYVAQRF